MSSRCAATVVGQLFPEPLLPALPMLPEPVLPEPLLPEPLLPIATWLPGPRPKVHGPGHGGTGQSAAAAWIDARCIDEVVIMTWRSLCTRRSPACAPD